MFIVTLRLIGRLWLIVGSTALMVYIGPVTVLDEAGTSYLGVALLLAYPAACLLTSPRRKPLVAPVAVRHEPNHLRLAEGRPWHPEDGDDGRLSRPLAPADEPLVTAA